MMHDDNTPNTDNETLASLSEVTPSNNNRFGYARLTLIVAVCAVFVIFAFMPKHEKAQDVKTSPSLEQKELTLSENLALIEKMKQQTEAAPKATATPYPRIRPPKLKQHPHLSKEILARMNAPTTFFNTSTQSGAQAAAGVEGSSNASFLAGNNPDTQFLNQQNDITMVRAKRLPHPNETLPAGEMIAATLETAINSELPGMVRAVTSRDSYSLQGENILIPRGSLLVGQFNSQVVEGQSRVLIVWNRVQLANGVIVSLNSPNSDAIGRAGLGADAIDRHFFERFGTSALLSVLGAYAANSGVSGQDQYNSQSQYRTAIASSFQQASGQTLQGANTIKPTLQINQGTQINVFVAHDLDFNGVVGKRTWK